MNESINSSRSEGRLQLAGYLQIRAASVRLLIDENVEILDVSGGGLKIASRVPFVKDDFVLLAMDSQKIDAQVIWSYLFEDKYHSGLMILEPYHLENWLQERGFLFEEIF